MYLFERKNGSLNVSQVGRLEGMAENLLRFTKVKLLGFQDDCLKRTALWEQVNVTSPSFSLPSSFSLPLALSVSPLLPLSPSLHLSLFLSLPSSSST